MNGLSALLPSGVKQLWRKSGFARPAVLQVAALCYRHGENGHEVLLVTSRGRGHWLLPKGWPKPRKSFSEMAALEAFEEAGVQGDVSADPIGRFEYTKTLRKGVLMDCEAEVYPLHVSEMAPEFPEAGERKLSWFSPNDAAEKVDFPQLRDLLLNFQP